MPVKTKLPTTKKSTKKQTPPALQMFDKYKFRPSMLPLLMTKSRVKDELSESVKSALLEIFIKEKYGREKIVVTKYMEKGIAQENESIQLLRKHTQQFMQKNEDRYQNDWLTGTPDIVLEDKIIDVKTSWDIWTFMKSSEKSARSDYYYQLVAYMILTKKTKAELVYCLVSNSEYTIYSELKKLQFSLGLNENTDQDKIQEIENQVRKNNTYEDIPIPNRVKIYTFDLPDDEVEKIQNQLQMCRYYLNNLNQKSL